MRKFYPELLRQYKCDMTLDDMVPTGSGVTRWLVPTLGVLGCLVGLLPIDPP